MRRIISLIVGLAMALLVSVALAPAANAHTQTWSHGSDYGWAAWGNGSGPNHYLAGVRDVECDGHRVKTTFRWQNVTTDVYTNDSVFDEDGCGEASGWVRSVHPFGRIVQIRVCEETDNGNWTCQPGDGNWYNVTQDALA